MSDYKHIDRRKFLQITGVVTGVAATLVLPAVTGAAEPSAPASGQAAQGHAANPGKPINRGLMFFSNELEFSTLSAAAERIFPKDENGPGAIDLAVPYFIDNQLAGAYGYNAREYTGGPHFPGAPTQGYQTPLLRRDVIKQGLALLNKAARDGYQRDFPKLAPADQDKVLTDCEAGKLPAEGFTSAFFFSLLRDMVLAGAYSDPIYNGNNNMDGWRLKGYPGAQMAYSYLMTSEKFEQLEPVSLSSMQ